MMEKVGAYAFIVGVILAIILGLFGAYVVEYVEWITYLMIILGVIVGFLNIAEKQAFNFLIAAIALLATNAAAEWSAIDILLGTGTYISAILGNIGTFVAPAAVIVALKAIWSLSYKKL